MNDGTSSFAADDRNGSESLNTVIQALNRQIAEPNLSGSKVRFLVNDPLSERKDLCDRPHALLVCRIMTDLNLDQGYLSALNLDHKLLQSCVLRTYVPEVVPRSIGLAQARKSANQSPLVEYLRQLSLTPFVIKAVRSEASRRDEVLTSSASALLSVGSEPNRIEDVLEERMMVQELFEATREYRVHTLQGTVIDSLIFGTFGTNLDVSNFERQQISAIMDGILQRLPRPLLSNGLIGWDLGISESNRPCIFEMNFAGLHHLFKPGFHCSGFFQHETAGCFRVAHLLYFLEKKYGCEISFESHTQLDFEMSPLQAETRRLASWLALLRATGEVEELWQDTFAAGHVAHESLRLIVYKNKSHQGDRTYLGYLDAIMRIREDLMRTW